MFSRSRPCSRMLVSEATATARHRHSSTRSLTLLELAVVVRQGTNHASRPSLGLGGASGAETL